jgi:uncharacterized protein
MTYRRQNRDEHLSNNGKPKRILTLDGGGLRGILTVGILQKIEDILRERHGNSDDFRLCDYFDLIAGTSTGAIIAAALATGWTVEQIRGKYMDLGKSVFEKSFLRHGLFRAKYDEKKLIEELKDVYGASTTLGAPELQTGLLVITKRLDTGSPWPISNNPRGNYYASHPDGTIGNSEYPLWQVVRSSTAAPAYFDPEPITIIQKPGHKPLRGVFIDGGASPFNNPALQTLMYATMRGYRIGWPMGADKLLLVSVGTGAADPDVKKSNITAKHAIDALLSLMDDCASLQETILQWMSSSPTARAIDGELGDLQDDLVSQLPSLSYLRYNVDLRAKNVQTLDPSLTDPKKIESFTSMDAPENMDALHNLGTLAAKQDVRGSDFASTFDLPS